jgi:tRNA (mo5U34)-methyltransferase
MIMPLIDRIFSCGLGGKYCLDVACNEGYFSHLLYHRGAKVKGIDIRETNIQRAKAVQGVYGYDPQRLIFQVEDFFSNRDEADSYDLTLFLGLLYHIENPMGALRLLHKLTKTLCVIDTQLTRQNIPIISGWGQASVVKELAASMALLQEEDMKENNLAAHGSLSFIPNGPAVRQLLFSAGFSQVLQVAAHPSLNPQYVNNDRGVFLAFK